MAADVGWAEVTGPPWIPRFLIEEEEQRAGVQEGMGRGEGRSVGCVHGEVRGQKKA